MASPTKLSSSSYSPFETTSANLRDDSFSSYLALIRQSFSTELANGANSRRSSFQTTILLPPPKRASKDSGELDVFDAEKYFNGSLDGFQGYPDLASETAASRGKKTKESATRSRSRSSTCSETSTNSHSVLLHGRLLQSQQQQQQPPSPAPRRRSFLDVFRCACSKKTAERAEDDSDVDRSNRSGSKLPAGVSRETLHSESSSDLFEIGSASMRSHPAWCEPSEASIEWSVTTASATNLWSVGSESERASEGRKARRSSGFLGFGCVSDKAVRSGGVAAAAETERVGSLERYHVMMELESASVARSEAARPRRASLGH